MRHCDELCCGAALLLSRNECTRDRLTGLGSTAGRASSSRKRASRPKLARPHRHRLLVLRDVAEEDRARRKRAVLQVAAAEVLQSSSRPLLYAAAAEDAGGQLGHADRGDEAVDQLNAAFDTYMQHEALADARRVGRELRRLGVQRRIVGQPRAKTGWDSLTDSELTVVNLVAQGVTNRSVAQRLHVSPHTVRAHLRNAFAKLGVSSRVELSQLVRGADHHAN